VNELKPQDEVISRAITLLSELTKEDFHGYRSEIWSVLIEVYRKGQSDTRPVLLPTDEEIEKEATAQHWEWKDATAMKIFIEGAEWLRARIEKGK